MERTKYSSGKIMTLQRLDSMNVELIRIEINRALKPIIEKYDLKQLDLGIISYNDYGFTTKLKCILNSREANKSANELLEIMLRNQGIPKEALDKYFIVKGYQCKITEVSTRSPKYPIIVTCTNDQSKKFKVTVNYIKRSM